MTGITYIKRSNRKSPKVSLILLDWSVRESFHLLYYLSRQNIPREWFEVTIIEYYALISEPLKEFEQQIDNWILLNVPENCYYHKHLMYNVGIAVSSGDIVVIGDTDAIVRETFIKSIVDSFQKNPNVIFHIDQFRNMRQDLYPFCYPDYDLVLGDGCINNVDGKTQGVLSDTDPMHNRNYGACMCATRADLISIGGADEHINYLGHICGPYDMTFRLINQGRRELWDMDEFMLHTWHPGQAGVDNYMGPHDGRHMSTMAIEALESGRILPFRENRVIKALRKGISISHDDILEKIIDPSYLEEWQTEKISTITSSNRLSGHVMPMGTYNGFRITGNVDHLIARPIKGLKINAVEEDKSLEAEGSGAMEKLKSEIDKTLPKHLIVAIKTLRTVATNSVATSHIKKWLREYLGAGYNLLKSRDSATCKEVLKRTWELPLQCIRLPAELKRIIGEFQGKIGSMAVAIYVADVSGPSSAKPIAIVDHWSQLQFLTDLGGRKNFPPFSIEMVSDAESIKKTLDRLEALDSENIVVFGSIFSHFHTLFTSSRLADRMIIV